MARGVDLRAPFPYYGNKIHVADLVWDRLGNPRVYAEPFAGALGVLFGRPGWYPGRRDWIEIVNDKDGFICNAWRAIRSDPDAVAYYADNPVFENDFHAWNYRLALERSELTEKLEGDPDYYDARIAGRWVWLVSSALAPRSLAMVGGGPWRSVDGRLVEAEERSGINRSRPRTGWDGVNGLRDIRGWMRLLCERLRYVTVLCGGWERVVTPSSLRAFSFSELAVFLDPPYDPSVRNPDLYSVDDREGSISTAVREWCLAAPDFYRIALCGFAGEGHEVLEEHGWEVVSWRTANAFSRDETGETLERIWFSPSCRRGQQLTLEVGSCA